MTTDRLTPLLAQRPWLLADGAMGSNLFARGLTNGEAPELWNTEHPQRIRELQRSFEQLSYEAEIADKLKDDVGSATPDSPEKKVEDL